MSAPIDFVIAWVDGSDPAWLAEKNKYSSHEEVNAEANGVHRYRDWNNLRYWFRSVEKFAHWVRKVHFVTCGHVPRWLNVNHPKLNHVKHADYIPKQYLPTFSANPIELNFHRIRDLSEQFVYFNDDMFIVKPLKERDFFVNGLPCEMALLSDFPISDTDEIFSHILLNNLLVIRKNFPNRKGVLIKNFYQWFAHGYDLHILTENLRRMFFKQFDGLRMTHGAASFLKSTFEEVWQKETERLDMVCSHKFRSVLDVSQYLLRQWQIMSGSFQPYNMEKATKYFGTFPEEQNELKNALLTQKYNVICINDTKNCDNFDELRDETIKTFDRILPEKSSFEI